ncbi:MAG: transglutaminase domain-containing protein [Planctomycetes bacterium]|nr:transglutaminase domain-containing protein [Planctomycetota bacterium]
MAFDPQSAQSLQYPRETIRKRSGTCIDLAILYAAMANSVGIRSYLALVPGHCFPVFRVPSGTLIGIESTGVAGGLRHGGTHLFEAVLDKGIKNLQKWSRDGRIHLLDLQDLWTRGISNPELPELPADIAKQWKLLEHCQGEEKLYGQGAGPDTGAGQGQGNDFAGTWSGTVTENVGGQQVSYGAAIKFQATGRGSYSFTAVAQAAVPNGQGGVIRVRVQSVGTGTQNGNGLQITTTRKVLTYLDTGATEQMNGDSGSFTLQNGRLVGKVGNQTDGFVAINFARK